MPGAFSLLGVCMTQLLQRVQRLEHIKQIALSSFQTSSLELRVTGIESDDSRSEEPVVAADIVAMALVHSFAELRRRLTRVTMTRAHTMSWKILRNQDCVHVRKPCG